MGPLEGVRIIEFAGVGPAPFCGMLLADLGADVIRIERASANPNSPRPRDPLLRSRRSIALNLKNPQGVTTVLDLIARADALIEGFRPGVMERVGLGPEICLVRNPRLVFGRMTGWGQQGPLAHAAGHDISYIALTGALNLIGEPGGKPVPPLNLVADFGGGGMLLAVGLLSALLRTRSTGKGEVIDVSMIDGAAALLAMFFGFRAEGFFRDAPGENFLAGRAPYYGPETSDGKSLAIGAIESQFFRSFIDALGIDWGRFEAAGYPHLDDYAVETL